MQGQKGTPNNQRSLPAHENQLLCQQSPQVFTEYFIKQLGMADHGG